MLVGERSNWMRKGGGQKGLKVAEGSGERVGEERERLREGLGKGSGE